MRQGLLEIMFLILFALKVADVIDWSWWRVCSPLFASWAILAVFVLLRYSAARKIR